MRPACAYNAQLAVFTFCLNSVEKGHYGESYMVCAGCCGFNSGYAGSNRAFQLTVNARTGDVLHNVSTAAFADGSFLLNTAYCTRLKRITVLGLTSSALLLQLHVFLWNFCSPQQRYNRGL